MVAAAAAGPTTNSWETSVDARGEYKRKDSVFRDAVTRDEGGKFVAEAGRYHLYVSLACPWAHRTLITRALKGLQDVISVTVVDWHLGPRGWKFSAGDECPGCTPDAVNGKEYLREVYELADPGYTGNVTVPTLWDTKSKTIVNNESSELIRMLFTEFNAFCATPEQAALDFYPADLRPAIDAVNEWIYPSINNGVYRCGFATSQDAYNEAFDELFAALDRVEGILERSRYLCGPRLTEADLRLFPTLIRFDACYVQHFKTNLRRIADYPALSGYVRELYQMPAIRGTCDFEHIKQHYMGSHKGINPLGIIPRGPDMGYLEAPHGRGHLEGIPLGIKGVSE